jgi:hypothetical protein
VSNTQVSLARSRQVATVARRPVNLPKTVASPAVFIDDWLSSRRHNYKRHQLQAIMKAHSSRSAVVLSRSWNPCKAEKYTKVEKPRAPTTLQKRIG